jgi:hypothetical protein
VNRSALRTVVFIVMSFTILLDLQAPKPTRRVSVAYAALKNGFVFLL